MTRYSVADVQQDWRCLDAEDFAVREGVRLVSHEEFTARPGLPLVAYARPGLLASAFRFCGPLFNLLYAWRLLQYADRDTVLILSGSAPLWLYVGLLNRFVMIRKRSVLLWDVFVEVRDGWRRRLVGAAMSSFRISVLWSRHQIVPHAQWLRLPKDRFVFIPYKANHSKGPTYDVPIGNYVFAGGNGKRDYRVLTEAVRNTGIPVVVSATDPTVRKAIETLPNVIALAAWEPAFAQLQAGARFTVVPMADTGLKGGGEANMCNGMWHGKPVITVDRMAAQDYIIDGETGFIVPPGDDAMLRRRMLELWNDTEKCSRMGRNAKAHADAHFTHDAFVRRLLRLAILCGYQSCDDFEARGTVRNGGSVLLGSAIDRSTCYEHVVAPPTRPFLFSRPLTLELEAGKTLPTAVSCIDLGSELELRTDAERRFRFSPRMADFAIRLRVAGRILKKLPWGNAIVTGRYGESFAAVQGIVGIRIRPMILLDVEWRFRHGRGLRRIVSRLYHLAIARGTARIGVFCKEEVKRYAEWYGIAPAKFVWIPYCTGVDPSKYDCSDGGYVFSGGSYDRDWATFFEAVAGLQVEVRVAAAKSTIPPELAVPANITLLGRLSSREFHEQMAGARLVALALRDNQLRFPGIRTYVAAMRLGKCVVVNDLLGAASYITHGENGVLVKSHDPRSLRAAILELLGDVARRERMADRAREYAAEHLLPEHYWQALISTISTLRPARCDAD